VCNKNSFILLNKICAIARLEKKNILQSKTVKKHGEREERLRVARLRKRVDRGRNGLLEQLDQW
jgi:hypothetical protein